MTESNKSQTAWKNLKKIQWENVSTDFPHHLNKSTLDILIPCSEKGKWNMECVKRWSHVASNVQYSDPARVELWNEPPFILGIKDTDPRLCLWWNPTRLIGPRDRMLILSWGRMELFANKPRIVKAWNYSGTMELWSWGLTSDSGFIITSLRRTDGSGKFELYCGGWNAFIQAGSYYSRTYFEALYREAELHSPRRVRALFPLNWKYM